MTGSYHAVELRDVARNRVDPIFTLLVDFVLLQQDEIALLRGRVHQLEGRVYQLEGAEVAVETAVVRAQADIAVLQSEIVTPPVHHPATHAVVTFRTPIKRGNA